MRESQNQTLMVLVEWVGSETEAFLAVLIAQVPQARLLLRVN
uniref:Uncharacterized protein n=1 Tax=Cupriavidus taiwanensis TaxID=164546 RepID=A0A375HD82_9BURK|nr:hypothetical protein [Cupriavidus taiwanensis]SPD48886.1 protein of unknown function [Cupriavidus taiwanensis]